MEILNKKKNIIIISIISLLIVISMIICFTTLSPKEEIYVLKSNFFEELNISNNIQNRKFNGETIIKDNNKNFVLNGTFENGVFKKGQINLLHNGITYILEGDFENFNLKEGEIRIITEDKIIIKNGFFVDNKLEGVGQIKITDKNTGEMLFNYAGKFENDTPIY